MKKNLLFSNFFPSCFLVLIAMSFSFHLNAQPGTTVIVTGSCNGGFLDGTYNYDGDVVGKPSYLFTHLNGNDYIITWTGARWELNVNGNLGMHHDSDTPNPPAGIWIPDGCNPTGTFSGSGTSNVLPVELLSFNLESTDADAILLRWVTASEINNEGFEVQHSTDGYNWEIIEWIAGAGNTFEIQNYDYNHQQPAAGINYYRLKQIDFDDEFEHSKVVSIDISGEKNSFRLAPNPTSGSGTISLDFEESNAKTIRIYNSIGAKVYQTAVEEDQSNLEISLPNLPQGIYTTELVSGRSRATKRMFIK